MKASNWSVGSVSNVALTSYMLTVAHNNHDDFRFVFSPSPGSKSVDIVSYQQVQQIQDVLFVTENHILVKFRYGLTGKIVIFNKNGLIVPQSSELEE